MNAHNPIKARSAATSPVRAIPESGREAPEFPCRECNGEGEAEYMGLDEERYHWRTCHRCHGSRVEAPYCETCEGTLTPYGYCFACDDLDSRFVLVERIAPGRIAV
jgi:hypothetical protein